MRDPYDGDGKRSAIKGPRRMLYREDLLEMKEHTFLSHRFGDDGVEWRDRMFKRYADDRLAAGKVAMAGGRVLSRPHSRHAQMELETRLYAEAKEEAGEHGWCMVNGRFRRKDRVSAWKF